MKAKIIIWGLVLLFFSPVVNGEDFGFTGEFKEIKLKQLSPRIEPEIKDGSKIIDTIKVLMIGFSSIEPQDTDFECFNFVTYYYEESIFDDWVAMIVANYGNKEAKKTTISIEVKGPKSSKIEVKRTIPQSYVMLYLFKFNKRFATTPAVYELIGEVNSKKIWMSRAVTRLYIDEIW